MELGVGLRVSAGFHRRDPPMRNAPDGQAQRLRREFFRHWTLDIGRWTFNIGYSILEIGHSSHSHPHSRLTDNAHAIHSSPSRTSRIKPTSDRPKRPFDKIVT